MGEWIEEYAHCEVWNMRNNCFPIHLLRNMIIIYMKQHKDLEDMSYILQIANNPIIFSSNIPQRQFSMMIHT